ncbi:MAG: ribosome biogenesis GTPase Der [Rhodospirillales bacterium]|nr:ribosome biogenesis GTPase Der [Rhodospirillales bacterium]
MTFTVALVGRPNVGKSTLFNRLVGKQIALVDDRPGVTRDRREGEARLGPLRFRVIDTAGLDEADGGSLEERMMAQTEAAVDVADIVLLLYDARAGITPLDDHFGRQLRGKNATVILVANKCEGSKAESGIYDGYGLGFGDPLRLSAEHGQGMSELYDALIEQLPAEVNVGDGGVEGDRPMHVAIVGRPNVGKSTLINYLLGEERVLTGPESGITRDAIAVEWSWGGRRIRLFDTAGMRRRAKVSDKVEKLSIADAQRAVRFAEVVVLLLDAQNPLEKQDLLIASAVVEEGRALVVALNKWDTIKDRKAVMRRLEDRLETSLPQVKGVEVVTFSALTGKGVGRLMPAVEKAYKRWNLRVSTSDLNRWLAGMVEKHPPPAARGRPLRLRYAAQVKTRPPTFAIFASRPDAVPDSYSRYLQNGLRESFGLEGVPLRIMLRKGKNPYAES